MRGLSHRVIRLDIEDIEPRALRCSGDVTPIVEPEARRQSATGYGELIGGNAAVDGHSFPIPTGQCRVGQVRGTDRQVDRIERDAGRRWIPCRRERVWRGGR